MNIKIISKMNDFDIHFVEITKRVWYNFTVNGEVGEINEKNKKGDSIDNLIDNVFSSKLSECSI